MRHNRELLLVRRRLVQACPILFGVILVNFLLLHAAPGDIADTLAGQSGGYLPVLADAA